MNAINTTTYNGFDLATHTQATLDIFNALTAQVPTSPDVDWDDNYRFADTFWRTVAAFTGHLTEWNKLPDVCEAPRMWYKASRPLILDIVDALVEIELNTEAPMSQRFENEYFLNLEFSMRDGR